MNTLVNKINTDFSKSSLGQFIYSGLTSQDLKIIEKCLLREKTDKLKFYEISNSITDVGKKYEEKISKYLNKDIKLFVCGNNAVLTNIIVSLPSLVDFDFVEGKFVLDLRVEMDTVETDGDYAYITSYQEHLEKIKEIEKVISDDKVIDLLLQLEKESKMIFEKRNKFNESSETLRQYEIEINQKGKEITRLTFSKDNLYKKFGKEIKCIKITKDKKLRLTFLDRDTNEFKTEIINNDLGAFYNIITDSSYNENLIESVC